MSDIVVKCPSCSTEVKLTESLTSELLSKRLVEEKNKIAEVEKKKALSMFSSDLEEKAKEIAELQQLFKANQEKLAESQKVQVQALKKQRELEEKERELDLTLEKKLQESSYALREKTTKEIEEKYHLKMAEKEQAIASMQKKLEEAIKKAEQGSQQMQGEVLELELENLLKNKFPVDLIEPVAKGEKGADVVQKVISPLGQYCGSILWESKRTKNWSESWITKLKDDQRASKSEVAILVSQALPKDIDTFDQLDGVWVTNQRTAIALAVSIRAALIELSMARQAGEGQNTKMEIVYQYLTGPRFRQRVEAIVEAFSNMKEDLEKEKRAISKQWSKREEQIDRIMLSTVGMYGDLQAIAGKSLQEIQGLDIEKLDYKISNADNAE